MRLLWRARSGGNRKRWTTAAAEASIGLIGWSCGCERAQTALGGLANGYNDWRDEHDATALPLGVTQRLRPTRTSDGHWRVRLRRRATKNPELNELQNQVDQRRDDYQDKHDSLFGFQ